MNKFKYLKLKISTTILTTRSMHLVHSALRKTITNTHQQTYNDEEQIIDNETTTRFLAYQTTCNKYRREIAAIQKYIPGWMPTLPTP